MRFLQHFEASGRMCLFRQSSKQSVRNCVSHFLCAAIHDTKQIRPALCLLPLVPWLDCQTAIIGSAPAHRHAKLISPNAQLRNAILEALQVRSTTRLRDERFQQRLHHFRCVMPLIGFFIVRKLNTLQSCQSPLGNCLA